MHRAYPQTCAVPEGSAAVVHYNGDDAACALRRTLQSG
jgi:hypothetical protein